MESFDVNVKRLQGVVRVCPVGDLDATAPKFDEVLFTALDCELRVVVIDLSGLTFLDCAGVRPIRQTMRKAPETKTTVVLCCASRTVQMLEIYALPQQVHDEREQQRGEDREQDHRQAAEASTEGPDLNVAEAHP